MIIILKWCF